MINSNFKTDILVHYRYKEITYVQRFKYLDQDYIKRMKLGPRVQNDCPKCCMDPLCFVYANKYIINDNNE